MKKKSLLILPVLLLALAACNKEEEVEEPEDNTPEVTEPTEPSDTSEDEKEDEKEDLPPVVIDERISVADGTASLTDSAQPATCSTYRNLSDLAIASVTEDGTSGDITYTLSGTASAMDQGQADVFWLNVAKPGDAYIVLTIKLEIGDVLTWGSNEVKYADAERTGEEDMIIRISGDQISEERKAGTATYTITDAAGESVKHIVDFSNVVIVDARVTLTTGSVSFDGSDVPFENSNSLYISSMSEDASGNVTYYVAGTPNLMTLCQEEAFQVSGAAGSAYVVLNVSLENGDTNVSFNGKSESATTDVIVRLVNYTDLVFTITNGESQTVTHTVVFSNLVQGLRVTLTPGEVDSEKWTNDPSLSLSATKGEDGNYTYALSGNLSKMTPCQASAFGANATENDEYVLLTVFLQSGEKVTWGTEISEEKTRCYNQYPNGMDVVLKVTSEGASSVTFTINDSSEGSVDHIIDLSAYVTPAVGA